MSSLALQLSADASVNGALLSHRHAHPSYLFGPRDEYDLDSVRALAINGARALGVRSPLLDGQDDTDRTLLTAHDNATIDAHVAALLPRLQLHLLTPPAGRILEWLVRRFRVHEFNVHDVLCLFFPYFESPHFAKMLSIVLISPGSPFAFLIPYKSATTRLRLSTLVAEMRRNPELARFIVSLLPNSSSPSSVLVSFYYSVMHEFLPPTDPDTPALLLPALLAPLRHITPEAAPAALVSLLLLPRLPLSRFALPVVVRAVVDVCKQPCGPLTLSRALTALVALLDVSPSLDDVSDALAPLLDLPDLVEGLSDLPATSRGAIALVQLLTRVPGHADVLSSFPAALRSQFGSATDNEPHDDPVLLAYSASAESRARGVIALLARAEGTPDADLTGALIARVVDPDTRVLHALYDGGAFLRLLQADRGARQAYLATLSVSAWEPDVSHTHLAFVFSNAVALLPPGQHALLALALPHLDDPGVWALLEAHETAVPLLRGCGRTLAHGDKKRLSSQHIGQLASDVARNISREDLPAHVAFFANLAAGDTAPDIEDKRTRTLATLVLAEIFKRSELKMEGHLSPARIALDALAHSGGGLEIRATDAVTFILPTARGALALQIAGVPISSCAQEYLAFANSVFCFATSPIVSSMATTIVLLRALFSVLGDDTLMMLSGVWSDSNVDIHIRTAALCHACAFLEASVGSLSESTPRPSRDFQTIVPSLLVAIQSTANELPTTSNSLGIPTLNSVSATTTLRQLALRCMLLIHRAAADTPFSKRTSVYAFDRVYGDGKSANLQYLGQADLVTYLDAFLAHETHITADANYLRVFQQDWFGTSLAKRKGNKLWENGKEGSKSERKCRHRVLCFLLSHARAASSVRGGLLRMLDGISASEKVDMLVSSIEELIDTFKDMRELASPQNSPLDILSVLLSSFDASAAPALNGNDDTHWNVYVKALRFLFCKFDMAPSPQVLLQRTLARSTLTHTLEDQLFPHLSAERQLRLCTLLVDIGAGETDDQTALRKLLAHLIGANASLISSLLIALQPTSGSLPSRASKRARLQPSSSGPTPLTRLAFLGEVLAETPLPRSIELIATLLDTLNATLGVQASDDSAETSFVQQLLMMAIEHVAEQTTVANVAPTSIRIDVLVELIRVAGNPQTFNQALLLMACLARLAPSAILRNIMPVFTFMGSNVFHRDDTYSFRVVQKTVDNIVPIMAASLKDMHTDSLTMYIAARDFLRIFTDAAHHIPRHRRTKLFTHLVAVLNPVDFLAPVCMLLVERSASRVVRQNDDDARATFALPLAVLNHHPHALQIYVLAEFVRESMRLIERAQNLEDGPQTLLDWQSGDEEHAAPLSSILGRRAHALVVFVAHAVGANSKSNLIVTDPEVPIPDGGTIKDLLALLITQSQGQYGASELASRALNAVDRLVLSSPVDNFFEAIVYMLSMSDEKIKSGTIELLSLRVRDVADDARRKHVAKVSVIISHLQRLISVGVDTALAAQALQALAAIGESMIPGEESALVPTVHLALSAIGQRKNTLYAVRVLRPLVAKLGPRLIADIRSIIEQCVRLVIEPDQDVSREAFTVLHAILVSLPTFWGSVEITLVVRVIIDTGSTQSPEIASLEQAMAKRLPAKALLPALLSLWADVSQRAMSTQPYFKLLKRVVRGAAREILTEHIKLIIKVFLEALERVKSRDSNETESLVIATFTELVVKLNDTSFRPLFRRLYDWAFVPDERHPSSESISSRHVHISLRVNQSPNGVQYASVSQGLMNPYMTYLLTPSVDALKAFATSTRDDRAYWACIVDVLTRSLTFDDGSFWRNDRLRMIASPLVAQVPSAVGLEDRKRLDAALCSLVECITDGTLLKTVNLDLLMHTRAENAKTRQYALAFAENMWNAHGGKLLGFVAETAPFIAECSEDENDMVAVQATKLKNAVERVAGNISGL
ncbi:hypothetical protein FISHEDRAFT_74431 [Fistulina hepatica ATCC 64428]|uniref:U3 small nucleolar RNA-associated protein 10 n=1 Tax=Fistulina hepatica ATCC 64428 TaxID=1128425 RepID=A0A0D7A9E3_9AGAR|nr:hypothetical protein FISHEDRAFT_74431 [Fistulina hepatica ATCC 64428]